MRLDHKLNLVVEAELANGAPAHVHATPVSRLVFEQHFQVIGMTFSALWQNGLDYLAGPQMAYLMLKQVATNLNRWEGPGGVENSFVAEIVRLANVAAPEEGGRGWALTPLYDVLRDKLLDEEQAGDLMNALVFFILVSAIQRGAVKTATLDGMNALWATRTTRFGLSEWVASLPTSTATETSPQPEASSVPS